MQVDAVLLQFRNLYRRVVIEGDGRMGAPVASFEDVWRDLPELTEFQKVERLDGSRFADLRAEPEFRAVADEIAARLALPDREMRREAKVLAVCSWGPGEGRSTLAFNLAREFAIRRGLRVVLVDYDFSHPSLKDLLRFTPIYGARELIEQRTPLVLRDVAVLSRADRIMVVPAIGGYPRHAKRAEGVGEFLKNVLRECDVLIVDTPRFVENDFTVLALAGLLHGLVLVKSRLCPRPEFQAMVERFAAQQAPVVGFVENIVP